MERAVLKTNAKAQLKGNVGKLFLCYLVVFAVSLVTGLLSYVVPALGSVASIIVSPPLSIGLILIYLGLLKGEEAKVGKMFEGFSYTGKSIWLSVLIAVFTMLWSLLLVIPGIVKSYSYAMAFYVLAENPEMTAREALNESKEIMNGHKMDLFILELSFILWILLVVVTFGIAAIYVVPYMDLTVANFYQSIKRKPQVEEPVVEEAPQVDEI